MPQTEQAIGRPFSDASRAKAIATRRAKRAAQITAAERDEKRRASQARQHAIDADVKRYRKEKRRAERATARLIAAAKREFDAICAEWVATRKAGRPARFAAKVT